MNRSKLLLVLFITIFQIGITVYAQKVSNITYRQEQSNIIVSYDLETKIPCKVSLYVSTNDGKIWQGPLIKITGDVGDKILSGSNSITWNVLEELEELRGDKIKFQVKAISNEIETVTIGNQIWMAKNLDVSTYRNGDIIPEVKDANEWVKLTKGAWCYYNNDPENGKIYGKLYNWYAVNDPRGLAPIGYHIPYDFEWTALTDKLGGESVLSGKMMSKGTLFKSGGSINYENSSGFSGLPGGSRNGTYGPFFDIHRHGCWWSSSEDSSDYAWYRYLDFYNGNVNRSKYNGKEYGFSVRCLRD